MKRIILAAIILAMSLNAFPGKAQEYEWVRTDGQNGDIQSREMSKGCARDNDGNLYVIATFGSVNGGSTIIGNNTLTSKGRSDVILIKYDANGNCIWVRQGGSVNYDYIYGLELDAQNNIVISGRFGVTAGGGPNVPMVFGSTILNGFGKSDCFIVKFSSNGDLIWGKSFGGTGEDQLNSMSSDSNGNLFFCGSYPESIYFGTIMLTNTTGYHRSYVAKMSSSGNFEWIKNTAGTNTVLGIDLKFKNNFIVLAGKFYGTLTAGSLQVHSSGESDGYIIKYDQNGNEQWIKRYGGTGYDEAYRVDIASTGDIFIAGSFDFTLDFGNNITVTAVGGTNTFLCKLDQNGSCSWAINGEVISPQGFSGGLYPSDVLVDSNGDSYLLGYFEGGIVYAGDTLHRSPAGECDSYLIKFSRSGKKIYIKQILSGGVSNASYTFALNLTSDHSDNIYISGYYSGRSTFDQHVLTANSTSHDMFIAKISGLTMTGDPSSAYVINDYMLDQNYPNPFNPSTTVNFRMATEGKVLIKVFDIAGKEVSTLADGHLSAGYHSVKFDGSQLQSGIYFYRMTVMGKYSETKRMILVK